MPESWRLAQRRSDKKRKVSSLLAGDVDEDIESNRMSMKISPRSAPWIKSHKQEYTKVKLTYSPAHKNPMRDAYAGNPWYEALTPRYQERILYWDERAPVADADPESFLDLHPVAHTCYEIC